MDVKQTYNLIKASGQIALSTTPALLTSFNALVVSPKPYTCQGFILANNDAAIIIYVAPEIGVSPTKFLYKIAAGATLEVLSDWGVISKLYVVAASGTPNAYLAIMQ